MSGVNSQSGLPDYVGDHFEYLVRSSALIRLSQAVFFITGLVLPVLMIMAIPDIEGNRILGSYVPLILIAAVFAISLVCHLTWTEMRRFRFRKERPDSYKRWFGWRNRRLGSSDLMGQMRLLRLQMRYVFLGKEPSPVETLELTMRFVRNSASRTRGVTPREKTG
jgi:hypothetical protein